MRQARPTWTARSRKWWTSSRNPRNMPYRMVLADLYAGTAPPRHRRPRTGRTAGARAAEQARPPDARADVPHPAAAQFGRGPQGTCQLAEADPVLGGDPTWAREEAMIYALQKRVPEAILKMGVVCKMAPQNLDFQRRIDMICSSTTSMRCCGSRTSCWRGRGRVVAPRPARQGPRPATGAGRDTGPGRVRQGAGVGGRGEKRGRGRGRTSRSMATSVAAKGPDGKRTPRRDRRGDQGALPPGRATIPTTAGGCCSRPFTRARVTSRTPARSSRR